MTAENWFAEAPQRRADFLRVQGLSDAVQHPMTHDMAPRFYHRIEQGGGAFVLLESAPDGHSQALVGHELGAFLNVQNILSTAGFAVPAVYAADERQGLILLEDFGDMTFEKRLVGVSSSEKHDLYLKATGLLQDLQTIPATQIETLSPFRDSRINQFVSRFADWFLPYYYDRPVRDDEVAAFSTFMSETQAALPEIETGFVHGDFHPPNLMVLKNGNLGLLDFQGAMRGPGVYDLVNLLHDARRDVAPETVSAAQALYMGEQVESYQAWYDFMSLHFHLRVIGQFIRVAIMSEKTGYLQHLERLRGYLQENKNSAFERFCQEMGVDFSKPLPPLKLERIRAFIPVDAS